MLFRSTANGKGGGEQYMVEARRELSQLLASLRLALTKVSASEKSELLKKLQRVKTA